MALTNAERQAAFKARKSETMDALAQQNAALLAEVAALRAELDAMREKAHRLEVATLKEKLKRAEAPAAKATPPKTPAKQLSKAPRQR